MTTILGISAYYHDSAATLLQDGQIVAAAQEERFTRIKGDASFPAHAIDFCLDYANLEISDIDHIVFYEYPLAHFDRLVTMSHLTAPHGLKSFLAAMPSWITRKLWLDRVLAKELGVKKEIIFCDHHISHAASAFYPSPFEEAAIITIDGVGEWSTTTIGVGAGNLVELKKELRFPNSVGLLYSAFTYFTGFKINSGEYKLMGLAPYGTPKYVELIEKEIIAIHEDGSICLNQRYFDYLGGLTMTSEFFAKIFGGPPRKPESPITQREMDIAASIQVVLGHIVLAIAKHAKQLTKQHKVVLAGGVALNVATMGELWRKQIFDDIWIQPAAGDAGGSLGAALWFWHMGLGKPRVVKPLDSMQGSFLGPEISAESVEDDAMLTSLGAAWEVLDDDKLMAAIASRIAQGKIVGLARGRMEWGPRALGARSILGDARNQTMQRHMNLKIKFRESFRPFAPMVLAEDAQEWFDLPSDSPYMLFAFPVKEEKRLAYDESSFMGLERLQVKRSSIPSVTHVDYSARAQTVDCERNPFMHGVLTKFKELTGCSVIINTSFNVRGEPIVATAEDAYRCFMATDIDALVIGNRLLDRDKQSRAPLNNAERQAWLKRFDLD